MNKQMNIVDGNVKVEIVTITPVMAKKMLERNTGNFRALDHNRVARYAKDMVRGWELTGDAIRQNCDGTILDGQTRLTACVQAGVSFKTLLVSGVGSALHIDKGKPRTFGQWLRHMKVLNYSTVAAIARSIHQYDIGKWQNKALQLPEWTEDDLLKIVGEYRAQLETVATMGAGTPCSNTFLGVVLFIGCGRRNAREDETTKWFAEALHHGTDLTDDDAVLHLRNRLLESKANSQKKLTPFMERMLITKAWNLTVTGEACTPAKLRITMTGPTKQQLPTRIFTTNDRDLT